MKVAIVALAVVFGLASARPDSASISNNCKYAIYVQSAPFGGQPQGSPIYVAPGGKYSEELKQGGSTLKIGRSRTFNSCLEFDYALAKGQAFYRFRNPDGQNYNPFSREHNVIDAEAGCGEVNCRPGDAGCYKRANPAHCPQPLDLVATICA